jgi:mono/diheme cytochrome c family protein
MKLRVNKLLAAILLSLVITATANGSSLFTEQTEFTSADTTASKKGEILIEQYCYSCHSPQIRGQQRLAPPFQMVKMHYLRDFPVKEDFINAITTWVKKPNAEYSIMPGALNRFGLMPPMVINEEDVKLIANYLYNADLPEFRGHGKRMMHGRQRGRD